MHNPNPTIHFEINKRKAGYILRMIVPEIVVIWKNPLHIVNKKKKKKKKKKSPNRVGIFTKIKGGQIWQNHK